MKNATHTLCLFLSFFGCLLSSCDGREEPIPSYLYIGEAGMETDYDEEGSASHKITDVKLFINDQVVGVFELPCTVPILDEGPASVKVQACFRNNGISATVIESPLHQIEEYAATLYPYEYENVQVDTIRPVFRYLKEDQLGFRNYDFEIFNGFESKLGTAPLQLVNNPELVFEGNKSCSVTLNRGFNESSRIGTIDYLPFNFNNLVTFLEVNYKSDVDFKVYVIARDYDTGFSDATEILRVRAKDDWNKIYIDLTQTLIDFQGDEYQFGFQADLPDSLETASYYFDNIKFVTRGL